MSVGERLEPRKMLAFDYLGITHTAVATIPTTQAYQYNFEIYNSGPTDEATMYMRHVANLNSLQFDSSTSFNTLANLAANTSFSVPGFGNGTQLPPVNTPTVYATGPVSLSTVPANSAIIQRNWNTGDTRLETFYLSKVYVRARPGTVNPTFILHVGDEMPLALAVDFSAAVGGTGTIIIRSNAAETYNAASPADFLPPNGAGYDFFASEVYVQAALNPRFNNDYRATDLIRIENAVTGRLDARVSDGDFVIAAGASVSGSVNVQTGGGIPPTAFTTRERYGYGGNGGDIVIEGSIAGAGTVVLQTFSVDPRTIRTGPSGFISGSSSITLNNAGADGGIINVETRNFGRHNIFAGSVSNPAADIGITVRQTSGNLTIDALPSSRGRIDLQATVAGANVAINSNFDTIGALALTASTLNVTRPLSTQQGDITLTGANVTLGSNVTAGRDGVGNIQITATTGNVNVTSAAVVQAPGDAITISAQGGSITSDATLVADRLELTAGQAVTTRSRVTSVKARAGGAVSLSDDDGLIVDSLETTAAGAVTVSAKGLLDVVDVATGGTGDVLLTTTAGGLVARDIRTQNGSLTLRADSGDIEARGEVFVNGVGRDFSLEATQGNIVMSPSSTFTVADQLSFTAPLGRVLTPGSITGVVVTDPGSGYVSPPAVTLGSGSGAVVTPTVGSGRVTFVRVLNGGSGYVSPPAVVFNNAGTGGTGVIATAVMSGGSVVGINITNGGVNYTSAPTISFVGGGGSGAEATASINGLTSLVPTVGGSGYQVPPQVVISSGAGGTTAAVDVDSLGRILAVNVSQGGASYDAVPTVVITDSSGSGFGATATAVLTPGVTAGVVTAGGTGYPATTTATVAGGGGAGATGQVLLGLTTASLVQPPLAGTGANYRIGDLLTVVAGTGARIGVTGVAGGAVNGVTVLGGGRDYSVGDVLYLNDTVLGATGLRVTVTAVTTGGVITDASVAAGGTGYTTAMRFLHAGGTGAILRVTEVNGNPTTTAGGTITAVVVDRPGTGYTTRPSAVAGGSGSGAAITFVDTSYTVVGYRPLTPGQGYTGAPTLTVAGTGGSSAAITPVVSGVLASINVGNPGTAYNPATTRVQILPVAAGGGASSKAVSINGAGGITGINLATPGGGYVAPPRVTIVDLGGTGSGATATATTSAGVTGVAVTNAGSGYTVAPTVTIRDVGGVDRGTRAVATVSAGGFVTGITITEPGSAYTGTPVVSFSSGSAAATAVTSQVVTGITITSSGANYDPATTVVTLEPIGSGATAVANLTGGVVTSISITDNGSGYGLGGAPAPTVTLVPYGSGALAASTVAGSGVGGVTVTAPGSNYAVPPVVTFAAPGGGGTTATGVAVVGNVAQLSATRLSWTALEQPLDALLDQFAIAKIVLTGAGDLDVTRASGDLVLEGAQTKDGSIRVAAQSLTVTGPVVAGDFNTSRSETVTLEALGGDLSLQAAVTAPLTVTLKAASGLIAGTTAGIVTTKDLVIAAQSGVTLQTAVETVRGSVSGDGAPLSITEADNLTVGTGTASGTTLSANNGPISVTSLGGALSVNRVDAGPTGSVALSAAVNVVAAAASPTVAEVVGGSATLSSTSGRIDLDTNVGTIAASAPLATIDLDAVGTGPVTVTSATARNTVRIEAASALRVEAANSELNNVALTTAGAGSHLVVGPISAPIGVVTLDSAGDISQGDLSGAVAATGARVRALAGSVTLATAVGTFGGTAAGDITVTEADGITLGEIALGVPADFARVQSNTGSVAVDAGGLISALVVNAPQGDVSLTSGTAGIAVGAITAGTTSGVVTLTAAQSITDNDLAVDITAFRAVLSSSGGSIGAVGDALDLAVTEFSATALLGTVDVTDAGGVVLTGLTTTAARLTVAGPVTQTAAITADTLAVTATTAGAVVLDNPANDVGTLTGSTVSGDFRYVDANGYTVGAAGITAGTAAVGDGNIVLTATTGNLGIAGSLTAANDRVVLAAPAGTITQTAGTITAQVLEWTAQAPPTFTSLAVSVLGPNLTGPGDLVIGTAGQPLTVASASTADGSITIVGSNVTIDGLVQAGGVGKAVAVNAGGSILFQNAGRIVNADATGSVGLTAGTTITAANSGSETTVTAGGLLTVNAGGATGLKTDVGSLLATTAAGGLTITDVGTLAVAGITAVGQAVSLSAAAGITQTGPIVAAGLSATTQTGGVILDAAGNDVDTVSGSTGAGNFVFTDADGFTVVAPGITAGSAGAGNGDIVLTALTGNLVVDANLTALDDTVRLRAPNGQLLQNPGSVITAGVLTWEAQSATLQPGNQIAAIGVNLTSAGPVRIPSTGTFPGTLRIAEVTTVDGAIEIVADDVIISGLVQAGGAASTVVITAATGGIAFIDSGRVVAQGAVTLGAATAITSATLAPIVNVTTPAALLATAGSGGIDLDTAVGGVTAEALGAIVLTEADAVTLTSVVSGSGSVTVVAGGTLTATSVSAASGSVNLSTTAGDVALGAVVSNATTGTVTVAAAGSITDGDAGVDVTAANAVLSAVTGGISADLAVTTVTATAPGTIDLSDVNAITLTSVVSSGGSVLVTAGGTMTATSVSAASGNVSLATTAGDVAVGSVTASTATGTATINAAGSITNAGPGVDVTAATAALTAGSGSITLDLAVAGVSATAPGAIILTDVDAITLAGVVSTGGNVTVSNAAGDIAVASVSATGVVSLTAAGGITDVDGDVDITGASAVLTALAGGIDADLAVGTVTATAPGSINLSDVDAVTLTSVVSSGGSVIVTAGGTLTATNVSAVTGDVSLATTAGNVAVGSVVASTTGGRATINAAGSITDGDPGVDVTASAATLNAGTGTIDLDLAVGTVGGTAAGDVTLSNPGGITLAGLQSTAGNIAVAVAAGSIDVAGVTANAATGTVTLDVPAGSVTQSGRLAAAVVNVNAPTAAAVTLTDPANAVSTLQTSIGGAALSMNNTVPLSIVADAGLSIGRVVNQGTIAVTTPGDLLVGPPTLPFPVLQSTTQLDLRQVQGSVTLVNGGRLVAPSILLNPSNPVIDVGGTVTTTTGLNQAVDSINSLPPIAGALYEIIVGANLALTQPLVFNRPVALSGPGFTLSGSGTAADGVVVNAGGSGSRITNLAFAGFTGTALTLNAAQNVRVSGITVSNSGTGLYLTGNLDGSTIQGNTFASNQYAMRLQAAQRVTIGGREVAQRNRIEGASRAGVLARGFCTRSTITGTVFTTTPRTRTRFNIGSSRNLRVSGTIVERTPAPAPVRLTGRAR